MTESVDRALAYQVFCEALEADASERDAIIAAKKSVIATGEAKDCEITYVTPQRRAAFALHGQAVRDGSLQRCCTPDTCGSAVPEPAG